MKKLILKLMIGLSLVGTGGLVQAGDESNGRGDSELSHESFKKPNA